MTVIKISKDSIEFKGHATDPVVCHAISGISQMVSNYLDSNGWGTTIVDHDNAYLKMNIKEEYREEHLIRAMEEALTDICLENPQSIELWIE